MVSASSVIMSALLFRLHLRPPLFSSQILGDEESMPEDEADIAACSDLPTTGATMRAVRARRRVKRVSLATLQLNASYHAAQAQHLFDAVTPRNYLA